MLLTIAAATAGLFLGAAAMWLALRSRHVHLQRDLRLRDWALTSLRNEQLTRQNAFACLVEQGAEALIEIGPTGRPQFATPNCARIIGYDPKEIVTWTSLAVLGPDAVTSDPEEATGRWRVRHADGRLLTMRVRCRPLPDTVGLTVMLTDVTAQILTEQRLEDVRSYASARIGRDHLTGLLDRNGLFDVLERKLYEQAEVLAMTIDIDGFRDINERFGNPVGDKVLRQIAMRLADVAKDALATARIGDDEFAILLPATDGDARTASVARDAIRTISEPIDLADAHLSVGAAIGIAAAPRDGTTAGNIMYRSSLALSHAKALGSGSYRFYEPRMGTAIEQAEALRRQLPAAIENGDVCPFLQPIVSLKTSDIVGFEILARWRHPTEGLISPARFLPLVEECGLSSRMFAKLLTRSCDIAMRWPRDLTLSVNVSPLELQDESLPDAVEHILADTGMPGHRLDIEITENALIDDSAAARSVVQRLRRLGVSFALDDFGTGFSSLYHLRELPFDKLKLDRSFVFRLDQDPDGARYVASIAAFARSLGLEVTVEGIEDQATLDTVRELGCTFGQGYLLGRPMPAEDAQLLLTASVGAAMAAE